MPLKELERLQALHRFLNLEINKDAELQEIVAIAADLMECQVGLITLIEGDRQHFLYKVGTELEYAHTRNSFCRFLDGADLMVVTDALTDERFYANPFVAGKPYVRFYAGAALVTHDGHQLGSFCVTSDAPKQLTPVQQHTMKVLTKRIIQIMEFEFSINLLKEQFLQAREAEIKLRSFFQSSSACHALINRQMEIMAYNKNMEILLLRMHDVAVQEGTHVSQILPEKALEGFVADFEAALTGRTITFEREVTYKNGERIWWYVSFEPGYDPDGEIIGISYNAADITERKLYEQKMLEQNKSLRDIAHLQSHELRKPVATILGLMEVLKQDHPEAISTELKMLEETTAELDQTIRKIVNMTE